jgi:hypothetical protein
VKNHKIAKNSTNTKAREKISTDLDSLEFYKNFDVCLTKFKNNQILLNKISHIFLLTTKVFIGCKSLIRNDNLSPVKKIVKKTGQQRWFGLLQHCSCSMDNINKCPSSWLVHWQIKFLFGLNLRNFWILMRFGDQSKTCMLNRARK